MSTTLQIRIDPKIKKAASKVFGNLGMDMSTGIKLYLKKVVSAKGIPFRVITENGLTLQEEAEILLAGIEARQGINTTGPMDADEALEFLRQRTKKHDDDENRVSQKVS